MSEASDSRRRRAADLIDYRIHQDCHRTHSPESGPHPASVCLPAIGRCLKDQYDAVAPPIPPRLVALIEKIKTQE